MASATSRSRRGCEIKERAYNITIKGDQHMEGA
jgi:hypothetical protein